MTQKWGKIRPKWGKIAPKQGVLAPQKRKIAPSKNLFAHNFQNISSWSRSEIFGPRSHWFLRSSWYFFFRNPQERRALRPPKSDAGVPFFDSKLKKLICLTFWDVAKAAPGVLQNRGRFWGGEFSRAHASRARSPNIPGVFTGVHVMIYFVRTRYFGHHHFGGIPEDYTEFWARSLRSRMPIFCAHSKMGLTRNRIPDFLSIKSFR